MVIKRPSGPTLLTILLIVLLPALAVLQYRWVGQVSDGERERMQRSVRNAANQFRDTFDDEITRAAVALNVGASTARDGESDQYSDRYNSWVTTAVYPQIVASIYLVDEEQGELRLRRWNPTTHVFEPSLWPPALDSWRPHFGYALEEFNDGRLPMLGTRLVGQESLIALPIRQGGTGRPGARAQAPQRPVFGFTVLELDMPYIRNQLIPQLAERYFVNPEGDSYRVQVSAVDDHGRVLYRSDPSLSIAADGADATEPLGDTNFFTRGQPRRDLDNSRWLLMVQHQSGSLEAAVGLVRRRNLAISFGVMLMLSVSVAMLAATSRKAERLAQQQMEFVAGVSHELRTPVAVIRSAAENLASGVVTGERVKRYGDMLESEARRLGEMVERVLQYAGIESGLGFGSRAPLAPAEIIDGAVESALALVGTAADVQVQRDVPDDLPPVLGDAPALRSAVQNLIANAVKYGGRDRWVGIRAQHVRERRQSRIRITVSDHGPGIPPAELPHIFEPFYRGADAIDKQIHGNGLGLSLVRRIVDAHGGRVSVSTKPGAGSAFTIDLPVAQADVHPTPVTDGAMQVSAHS